MARSCDRHAAQRRIICHACKIQEATDGCGSGARGETWETKHEFLEGGFETDGEIDEREATQGVRIHQTEKITEEEIMSADSWIWTFSSLLLAALLATA